jgi:hypothetical protein
MFKTLWIWLFQTCTSIEFPHTLVKNVLLCYRNGEK